VRGSVSLNVALCEHHPEIIKACADRCWEFFSHGIYNTRYTYGMDEAQERAATLESDLAKAGERALVIDGAGCPGEGPGTHLVPISLTPIDPPPPSPPTAPPPAQPPPHSPLARAVSRPQPARRPRA